MEVYSPIDIVDSGLCIGCGICVAQSRRKDTRMRFDGYGQFKPYGPREWYDQPSEGFSIVCPFSPQAKNEDELSASVFPDAKQKHVALGRYQTNYAGHVQEDDYRMLGSSGGMVTWTAVALMRKGLIDGVVHVVAVKDPQHEGKFFKYRISRNEEEIKEGAKSRYYPVELSGILETIMGTPGKYAVVAVPCMIKAIQLLRRHDPVYRERIRFTLGLFCGHMKSARFVESFAWQMHVPVKKINQVDFRNKYPDRPANWYNTLLTLKNDQQKNKDWWHLKDGDWGAGFFMNSACNYCDDVVAETADISFGDAWVEPYSSDGKGTNVVIVRSALMGEIIQTGILENSLNLEEVSAELVAETQAAGLRQRREGLAYRLTWPKKGIQPIKRVSPGAEGISKSRQLVYWMRFTISKWSHRMFWLARTLRIPFIYLIWARMVAACYHGIAYHHGSYGEMKKRFRELKS